MAQERNSRPSSCEEAYRRMNERAKARLDWKFEVAFGLLEVFGRVVQLSGLFPWVKVTKLKHSRGWLRSHLAWADIVERCGYPRQRDGPAGKPARASRRRRRHAQPLSRRSGARRDRRLPVSTERQPAARSQIRLQTGLVRTADQLRRRPLRQRSSSSACGRLQRRSDR